MKTKKLTPVQQKVMNRFSNGEKLVCLPTRRLSGEEYFWCRLAPNGLYAITEKALYPQLRQLFWDKKITEEMFADANLIDREYNESMLHYYGVI